MKKLAIATIVAAVMSPAAFANQALAEKKNCMACHQTDKKLVGPSYKEVAAKYRTQKDAQKLLVEKVKKGGVGAWGQIPMPPNPGVPDADLNAMVKWILAQK
ncbi:MAG: c-type cytochrome [Pseudomonadota bacterium]